MMNHDEREMLKACDMQGLSQEFSALLAEIKILRHEVSRLEDELLESETSEKKLLLAISKAFAYYNKGQPETGWGVLKSCLLDIYKGNINDCP